MIDEHPQAAAREPAIDAILAQPLSAASPDGIRMAHRALNRVFENGKRDLDGYACLMKLLIAQALDRAAQAAEIDSATAKAYKEAAIPVTFNLAANTWIGWGPGQVGEVASIHERLGLAAARRNIQLATEVGLGPERRRNGYWILGAQLLIAATATTTANFADAAAAFATSRELAAQAQDETAACMAQGWLHVTAILAGGDETAALDGVRAKLRQLGDDGAFYADQYDTALAALHARARQRASRAPTSQTAAGN